MFNPFKKKQQVQEEQNEPYLPPDLERFRSGVIGEFTPESSPIPEKERKFRAFAREMENPSDVSFGFGEKIENAPAEAGFPQNKSIDISDRLDMVLQKLETIDLRLKLIEQKLERRAV